jgi:hypothetical protein
MLSTLLLAADELTTGELAQSSLPLFVGDVIGIDVVTPLILRLSVRWPDLVSAAALKVFPELLLYMLAVGGRLWLGFRPALVQIIAADVSISRPNVLAVAGAARGTPGCWLLTSRLPSC